MITRMRTGILLVGLSLLTLAPLPARAEQLPENVRTAIEKGLKYLAKNQNPDGHWAAAGGTHTTAMTGVAGMAFLMEGSTVREGKYRENVRKAVDWLMGQSQTNGLIGNMRESGGMHQYMYGHGFAVLFLSQVYGEEEEGDRRKKLEDILVRAVQFTRYAQTDRGGWGYVSAKDGGGFDEGSVTVTQVQSLRAARNAGIAVPNDAITSAVKYLKDSTNSQGGVIYSLAQGGGGAGRPALTAAAISCGFSSGDYHSPLVKKWFEFLKINAPMLEDQNFGGGGRFGMHDEYTQYYYAQSIYALGEEGHAKIFPSAKASERLTWNKYKKELFPRIIKMQSEEGSFPGMQVGPIFSTGVYLTILQLDLGTLPIYQR